MEKIQKLVMSKNKIAGGSWIRGTTVRERKRERARERERERDNRVILVEIMHRVLKKATNYQRAKRNMVTG